MTTRVFTAISGRRFVESNDPAIPTARIDQTGDTPAAACDCGAMIRLEARRFGSATAELDGVEYQLHYITEHIMPAIRYEETAS